MSDLPSIQVFFVFFAIGLLMACKEEVPLLPPVPTTINLSTDALYEGLPAGTNVAFLSTDVEDPSIRYRLVSGEGDEHNANFEISTTLLKTREQFRYDDGATRSIRMQTISPSGMFEQVLTIQLIVFEGTYPSLSSNDFEDGEFMPKSTGGDHENISPNLAISDVPANTVSMVLAMIDLDFNNGWHWAVWNIPPDKILFPAGASWSSNVVLGDNDFGMGYTGPFPPSVHRYRISVYFLDTTLDLEANEYARIPTEVIGHTIAQASIIGKYQP